MTEDNSEVNKNNKVTRRDFLKLSAAGLVALVLKPKEETVTTFDKEPVNLPEPEHLLLVKLVDRSNPVDKSFIDETIEPNTKALRDCPIDSFLRRADYKGVVKVHKLVLGDLEELLVDSSIYGVEINIRSGFQDWFQQKWKYIKNGGEGNKAALPPGTSQHHTGFALDFTTPSIGNVVHEGSGFEKTEEYKWLGENAWKYGFVLSYPNPDGNNHDGITFEPWHWIYVGKNVAEYFQALRKNGWEGDIFDLQKAYSEKDIPGQQKLKRRHGGGGGRKNELE